MSYLRGLSATTLINDVPPTSSQKVAWYNILGQWKQAVTDWNTNLAAAQSQSSVAASIQTSDPTLYKEYTTLMASVPAIQSRIDEMDGAIADVDNWLAGAWTDVKGAWSYVKTSVTSLFGYQAQRRQDAWRGAMGDLGQWQLVPLAVVAAGAAYVGAKALDLYKVHTKLAAVQKYVAQGMSVTAATALVQSTASSPGLFSGLTTTVKYSAIALLAGAVLIYMMKRKP